MFSEKMLSNNLKKYKRNESQINSVRNIYLQQTLFEDSKTIDTYMQTMLNLQKEYFITSDNKIKKDLKQKIDTIQMGLIEESLKDNPQKLESFKLDSKKRNKSWFIWELEFFDVFKNNGGFDIVIGNPPYGAEFKEEEKQYIRKKYDDIQFKIDSYAVFLLKSIELSNGGVVSLIIPNTLLNNYFLEKIRINLIKNNKINYLMNFDSSVFEAVVHSLIIQFECTKSIDNYVMLGWNINKSDNYIAQKDFLKNENCSFVFADMNDSFFNKIKKNTKRLDEIIDLRQTIKSGNDKKYIVNGKISDNYKKILRGKDIQRYRTIDPNLFINYGKHLACPRDYKIFEQPHILIRESGKRITATLDEDNFYIMSSLYCGILIDKNYSLKYILGLLNSNLFQYLMFKINFENTGGAFTKAKIYHYNQLPIKKTKIHESDKIIELVDSLLNEYNEAIDNELNNYIYDLYELTNDEIELIESII